MTERYWDLLYFVACVIGGGAAIALAGLIILGAIAWLASRDNL